MNRSGNEQAVQGVKDTAQTLHHLQTLVPEALQAEASKTTARLVAASTRIRTVLNNPRRRLYIASV